VKRRLLGPTFAVISVLAMASCNRVQLAEEEARINYSVGYRVGSDFRRQGVELAPELVVRGVADAMSGAEPSLTQLEMQKELISLQQRVEEARRSSTEESGEASADRE